jgi:hypothetical protein
MLPHPTAQQLCLSVCCVTVIDRQGNAKRSTLLFSLSSSLFSLLVTLTHTLSFLIFLSLILSAPSPFLLSLTLPHTLSLSIIPLTSPDRERLYQEITNRRRDSRRKDQQKQRRTTSSGNMSSTVSSSGASASIP